MKNGCKRNRKTKKQHRVKEKKEKRAHMTENDDGEDHVENEEHNLVCRTL